MDTLTLVFLALAVIGVPAAIYPFWQMWRSHVPPTIPWRRTRAAINAMIADMRRDNWTPEVVIGLGRSGAVLGGLIAGNMRNLPIAVLDRRFETRAGRRDYHISEYGEVKIKPECRRVLVVTGEVNTGQTLTESLRHLECQLNGKDCRTATLVLSRRAAINVDYVGFTTDKVLTPPWVFSADYVRPEARPGVQHD